MLVCLNLLSSELNIGDMPNFEGIIIGPFYIKKAFGGGGGIMQNHHVKAWHDGIPQVTTKEFGA
jgi:hypothetical protein